MNNLPVPDVVHGYDELAVTGNSAIAFSDAEIAKAETTAPPSYQSNTRSWEDFAGLINMTWRKGVTAFIDTGRYLLEAKAKLDRDVFESLVKRHLDFDPSVGRKLMAIAGNSVICAHGHKLPPCWTTIYELTKVKDDVLKAALAVGTIHPGMERKDASALRSPTEQGQSNDPVESADDTGINQSPEHHDHEDHDDHDGDAHDGDDRGSEPDDNKHVPSGKSKAKKSSAPAVEEDVQVLRDLVLEEYFAQATGADIYGRITANKRADVVRGFLDIITVAGVLEAMSEEFGQQLRAKLPTKRQPYKPKKTLTLTANS
ncbi:MAG: hypothetical protein WB689_02130, partial [Xanthobacteraceae bacterium]